MYWNTLFWAIMISTNLAATQTSMGDWKISRCKVDDTGVNNIHYTAGVTYQAPYTRDAGPPPLSVVHIRH